MGEHKPGGFEGKTNPSPAPELKEMTGGKVVRAPRSTSLKLSLGSRRLMIALAVVVIVGGSLAGYAVYRQVQRDKTTAVCGEAIVDSATEQQKLQSITGFDELVKRIKDRQGYDKDPNCLYIIAESQITAGDLASAKATIDTLRHSYGQDYTFHPKLNNGKASVKSLEDQYNLMNDTLENSKGKFDPDI